LAYFIAEDDASSDVEDGHMGDFSGSNGKGHGWREW
jgi:hypothetical protein